MNIQLRRCAIVKLLSYVLFAVVASGIVIALQKDDVLWAISFLAAFIAGAIAMISVTDDTKNT